MTPFPVVLSAPSGAGKTTIARELMQRRGDVGYSVSCTTRTARAHERNGHDYHFLADSDFQARVAAGEFAEWALVHGKRYGTLRSEVQRVLDAGKFVLMDIDVQGARQFVTAFPASVLVFVLPPSVEALVARLKGRNTESPADLAVRLNTAHAELQDVGRYNYVVVNDALDQAVENVSRIIDAERLKRDRVHALDAQISRLLVELQDQIDRIRGAAR
ncbi:MAG: guanylate kinase [Gemmatimonadetes bacterium]|nr:guanylate kinase [Gemmatimonadota bacterium]